MVFSKTLANLRQAYPRYSKFFLDYEKIKRSVDTGSNPQDIARLLKGELDKVNDIVELDWEVIQNELKSRLRRNVVEDRHSLDNLREAVLALASFVDTNALGFRKIIRKCEERQPGSHAWFLARVEAAPFRQRNFDVVLGQLGQLYALWRQDKPGRSLSGAPGANVGDLVQTFFVAQDKVMRVKAAVLQHLRPDIQGAQARTFGPLYWRRHSNVNASYECRRPVTHVYLDNPRGDEYAERRRRRVAAKDAASPADCHPPFRLRWVGENSGGPEFEVHVDIEGLVEMDIALTQRDIPALVAGTLDPLKVLGQGPEQQQALAGILTAISTRALRPTVSATFSRTTFVADRPEGGEGDAPAAIATIDEDLSFRDEAKGAGEKAWCRAIGSGSMGAMEGFPGAILRLRADAASVVPLLGELEALDLRPVPGFSKALHGMALLHRELAVPRPPWCPSDASGWSSPPAEQAVEQPAAGSGGVAVAPAELAKSSAPPASAAAKKDKAPIGKDNAKQPGALSKLCGRCLGGSAAENNLPLRVDSKTPMANERTMLRWLRSAVLLSSLSAFLSSCPELGARINGLFLALLSLLFVFGPLVSFRTRSFEMADPRAKKPRQDYVLQQMLGWSLVMILVSTLLVDWVSRNTMSSA